MTTRVKLIALAGMAALPLIIMGAVTYPTPPPGAPVTVVNTTTINVSGKAQFNQIIITNGFFSATNVWGGPSNTLDMSIYGQYYASYTACKFTGLINYSNTLASEISISIKNLSASNFVVTYNDAGFVDRDHVTSQTITNGTIGIFWLRRSPALGGMTNIVFNVF
jgi:hypothetical protein